MNKRIKVIKESTTAIIAKEEASVIKLNKVKSTDKPSGQPIGLKRASDLPWKAVYGPSRPRARAKSSTNKPTWK